MAKRNLRAAQCSQPVSAHHCRLGVTAIMLASAIMVSSDRALADEGGVSFWIPGLFGSLAAVPQQLVGRWGISTIIPPYRPAPTWRGRANSPSTGFRPT